MRGFIYIMSNPSYRDGIIKIGKSAQDPEGQRVSTLRSTGVPSAFKVEYYAFVKDYDSVERQIHHRFASKRVENDREFFTCSVPEAIVAIREIAEIEFEKIYYKSEEEIAAIEAEKRAKALEKEKKRQEEEEQKRRKEQARRDRAQELQEKQWQEERESLKRKQAHQKEIIEKWLSSKFLGSLALWIFVGTRFEINIGWVVLGFMFILMMFFKSGRKALLYFSWYGGFNVDSAYVCITPHQWRRLAYLAIFMYAVPQRIMRGDIIRLDI